MVIVARVERFFTRKLTMKALFILYIASTFLGLFWIGFNFNNNVPQNSSKEDIAFLTKRLIELEKSEEHLKSLIKSKETNNEDLPIIFVVTPTHSRLEQKAELTRLCQCFMHVPKLHWIVVEDRESRSRLVENFLSKCKVVSSHLFVKTPDESVLKANESRWKKPRGVQQRNVALSYLRFEHSRSKGVVFFADDDNVYDLELFNEMRHTQKASVWPVGLVGKLKYETPVLDSQGKVIFWRTAWKGTRKFALDMAGFAVNLKLITDSPKVQFRSGRSIGMLETNFLSDLNLELSDLEPKANGCTQVLVWHTRTEKPVIKNEGKMLKIPVDQREV
ncbi:DgyrCDS760 [Dimorphilus gyrociliatus]|uniref:Galactosylgalactosylxylosylprotein 3-beta-glucuronosyltransferase n=1 Tax=Dimorphilus gyrociliatus TaxID=2664684 RepID=A0A7I8V5B8_9ANNE|nr:DgyrCDS760 [Dimorphilus gyrociliatus]